MKRICVFAGSNAGVRPEYLEAAQELGRVLVERRIGLVYGGASVGLMGALADTVLVGGGDVTGVMPEALVAKEVAHTGLPDLRIVSSMHERKVRQALNAAIRRGRRPCQSRRATDRASATHPPLSRI
jgi:uncharacterized protein (TIGR00730 family)